MAGFSNGKTGGHRGLAGLAARILLSKYTCNGNNDEIGHLLLMQQQDQSTSQITCLCRQEGSVHCGNARYILLLSGTALFGNNGVSSQHQRATVKYGV